MNTQPIRYAVFLSSTYEDLKDERREITKALQSIECIPFGMELFPAGSEEQLEYIKKQIEICDYYLLIIGERYGSIASSGKSYTEIEFDYAVSLDIPVIVLEKRSDTPDSRKVDVDTEAAERLSRFKEKARDGRVVVFWEDAGDLYQKAVSAIAMQIRKNPRPGWVRNTSDTRVQPVIRFDSTEQLYGVFEGFLKSGSVVYDLTWAKANSEVQSDHDELSERRFDFLEPTAEFSDSHPYKEIFIFTDGHKVRKDRLAKLRFHYERAKRGEGKCYSCGYFKDTLFPRLQYTLIDMNEILFTSGSNERIRVTQENLALVFRNYFDAAWNDCIKLIINGKVENESEIKLLLGDDDR